MNLWKLLLTGTCASALATTPAWALGTTKLWTNGGGDSLWTNSANWDDGVPGSTNNVNIATQPSGNVIGLNTGLMSNTVSGFTFGAALTGTLDFTRAGVEQLQIGGALANASAFNQRFSLPLQLAGSSVATGGGLLFAGGLQLGGPLGITGSGAFALGSGASTVLKLDAATFGRFNSSGTLNYNDTNFVFDVSGTATPGKLWDVLDANVIAGSLQGVALAGGAYNGVLTKTSAGTWTGVVGGLSWRYTEADGQLLVVPEPSATVWLLAAGALAIVRRRRDHL